jgi:ATP-dependent Lon protease
MPLGDGALAVAYYNVEDGRVVCSIRKFRKSREAGARSLEREIGKALRNVAVRIAEGSASAVSLNGKDIGAVLGSRARSRCGRASPAL